MRASLLPIREYMTTLVAIAALLIGIAALGVLAFRYTRDRRPASTTQEAGDEIRRRLAVLKVEFKDGKLSEEQYKQQRRALATTLLDLSRRSPARQRVQRPPVLVLGGTALAGLALGIGLLWWQTTQRSDGDGRLQAASPTTASHPLTAAQLEHSVEQMRERVKANPEDATAWAMLAHSYDMLGRYAQASEAYAKLVDLVPNDAQVLADYADSLAVARGRKLDGQPLQLIERALALDPKNLKALSLAGTEAYDRKDYARAIAFWERARAQVNDEALRQEIDSSIADARRLQSGGTAASGVTATPVQAVASASAGFVAGRVTLSEQLKSTVSANDTLFIFARPADGSRMPIALMRRRASELPLEFRLDDSMAMVPQMRLSGQTRVIVGARISKRGDASPQAGDLQGFSQPVAVGTKELRVDIAEMVK
jgi:cytochrome c-type biogenesis protein CcmH